MQIHLRDSSLPRCVRSAAQWVKTIIPPCEEGRCVWRLDGVLETARPVQTDAEDGFGLATQEKLEHTGICRCFDRHVLLVQLRLAACTLLGGHGLAGSCQSVCLSVWTGLSDALGLLLFLSARWDYLEYLLVRHTPVVSCNSSVELVRKELKLQIK